MGLLDDFREKYPAYRDVPDDKLADGLYNKFYADKMSRDEFNGRINPNVVADVAKSVGSGLVTGAEGAAGFLGDLRGLMQGAGDRVGEFVFGKEGMAQRDAKIAERMSGSWTNSLPFSQGLPSTDQVASAQRSVTGFKPHQPRTLAGTYANTAAEFVPGALAFGPAKEGLGALASSALKFGVVPGLTSEAAGQTARTVLPEAEGIARFAGAFGGPLVAAKLRRTATPTRTDPVSMEAAATLRREGVETTAGQATGNTNLKYAESELGGRAVSDFMDRQAEQFTRAALKRAGVNATRATPEVMDDALRSIGDEFDALASGRPLQLDATAQQRIMAAYDEFNDLVAPTQRAPMVERIVDDLTNPAWQRTDRIPADAYQRFRSSIDKAARTLSKTGDPAAEALWDMRNALDDAMEASLPAAQRGRWADVRRRYRNLLPIERAVTAAGEDTAKGLISPARLRSAVVNQNRRQYMRGQGDLADLARAGEAVLKPLPQSGTAPRLKAQGKGGLFGPNALNELAARMQGSAMMSPLGQQYLRNQMFPVEQGLSSYAGLPAVTLGSTLPLRRELP